MNARQDKPTAITNLHDALQKIPELMQQGYKSPDFEKWKRDTRVAIENAFGSDSRNVQEFTEIRYTPLIADKEFYQDAYLGGLQRSSSILESMVDEIKRYWLNNEVSTAGSSTVESVASREVFLIHGRDEGVRDKVARFLGQLELEPVILAEQASQGKTIIEKFEDHAQVGFAIALLTPDDTGSLSNDVDTPRPRARQNVIFELGYFIGRLGREGVCALTKGDVEVPSDYSGVVYIPMDDGDGWEVKLVRELKAAGLTFDANRAF